MYSKILVPLDGSKLAEKAIPYVGEMALRFGKEVVLVNVRLHAEDSVHPDLKGYLERRAGILERVIREASKREEKIKIRSVTIDVDKFDHHAAESIVDYANDNADIIVMSSHGHSGIKHWALGGVSDKVLQISNVPVLMIRANRRSRKTFDKILVPLDGSEKAESILPHVDTIAAAYHSSHVVLLRTVEPFFLPAPGEGDDGGHIFSAEEVAGIQYRHEGFAEEYLRLTSKKLNIRDSALYTKVLVGNTAEMIIEYAKRDGTDLIMMSTSGHSDMKRWTLGSVTERILHHSNLPVLLVRSR